MGLQKELELRIFTIKKRGLSASSTIHQLKDDLKIAAL